MYVSGCIAFVLFFINDINDWKLHKAQLKFLFPLGLLILLVSSIWMILEGDSIYVKNTVIRILIGLFCLLSLGAEIHSLFFSYEPKSTYVDIGKEKTIYKNKFYALCRHPGVLFFVLLYAGLSAVTQMPVKGAGMLCALNLFLIIFEDDIIFPAIFVGYDKYKLDTPFLIPNTRTIYRCINDFRSN